MNHFFSTTFIASILALSSLMSAAQNVKLSEVEWHGTGCYKIEMPVGTVYFEKDNGVSGFKSMIDPEGNDWIASYLEPGPNGDFRGFPNSVGNFGHAGRDSGSKTTIVDGKTEGDVVILKSSNNKFTFQYWFFTDRVAIKVLKSEGEYCFLLECVAGGTADNEDYFVTADGKKHMPTEDGEFDDFTPEWFYLGDPKSNHVLFLAKTPNDDAPNENHRQIRKGNLHNMDLYSFGRTGQEHKYKVRGMSGNEHVCIIGFHRADRPHNQIAATIESFMEFPFTSGVRPKSIWSSNVLENDGAWFASDDAREMANSVIQYQSSQGGWPKSTDLARPPLTEGDIPPEGGGRANSLDNDATTVPMEFLARIIQATGENPNMDYIKVAEMRNVKSGMLPRIQVLEAEDGTYTGKEDHHSCWNFIAQTEAPHSGFTGEGYVDTYNKVGSHIEIEWHAPNEGEYHLDMRYVHGKPDVRPAEVLVNGVVANPSLSFTNTGAWTAWTTISTPIKLQKGKNVIRLTALGPQGLVNMDHFAFRPILNEVKKSKD